MIILFCAITVKGSCPGRSSFTRKSSCVKRSFCGDCASLKQALLGFFVFRWRTLADGLMEINGFTDVSQIPSELQFSDSKKIEMMSTKTLMWAHTTASQPCPHTVRLYVSSSKNLLERFISVFFFHVCVLLQSHCSDSQRPAWIWGKLGKPRWHAKNIQLQNHTNVR